MKNILELLDKGLTSWFNNYNRIYANAHQKVFKEVVNSLQILDLVLPYLNEESLIYIAKYFIPGMSLSYFQGNGKKITIPFNNSHILVVKIKEGDITYIGMAQDTSSHIDTVFIKDKDLF